MFLVPLNPFKLPSCDGSTTKSLHEDICRDNSTTETETFDEDTGSDAAISLRLGSQTDSECDETWQTARLHYNKTARQVATHSENIFMPLIKRIFGGAAGARECERGRNGQRRELGDLDGFKF